MNQKGFVNIVLVVIIVAIIAVSGYFVFIKKSKPVDEQKISTTTPTETAKQNTNQPPAPTQNVENKKSVPQQQIAAKVQTVPVETLNQKVKIIWDTQPPQNFNQKTALGQIQSFVYAFPGYQYETLSVEMTDTKTSFTRNSQEREQAKQQGDFIFDIIVHGSLEKVDEKDLQMSSGSDTYFFNFSFSEKNGTYALTGKEFTLYALSPETVSKAKKNAGVSENLSGVTTGWLKTTGGELWYSGVKDGIVYINVVELDGSGPELGIKSSKTYYVDIFEGRVIRKTQ